MRLLSLGLALRAEGACGDIAAAADAQAPDAAWRAKLEELTAGHRDCVEKLTVMRQEVDAMTREPIHSLDATAYLGALDSDPAPTWPAVVRQLIAAERDAARYHNDFVSQCDDVPAASSRAFRRAAKQDRAAADELSEMLEG